VGAVMAIEIMESFALQKFADRVRAENFSLPSPFRNKQMEYD
jgi:hypothetical protein